MPAHESDVYVRFKQSGGSGYAITTSEAFASGVSLSNPHVAGMVGVSPATTLVAPGTPVTLTVFGASGYAYFGMSLEVDGVRVYDICGSILNYFVMPGDKPTCTFPMPTGNLNVVTYFVPLPDHFALDRSVTPLNSGQVSISTSPSPNFAIYYDSSTVPARLMVQGGLVTTLTAEAFTGRRFVRWANGPCANSTNPVCSFTMPASAITSNAVFEDQPLAATVPGAPTNLTASAGNATVLVAFTPPANNGGSAVTGYTVVSTPAGGVDSNAGTNALSHTITGLTSGISYTFTVKAINAVGSSLASLPSNAVTLVGQSNFSLTVVASPTSGGLVGGAGSYAAGTSRTVTAVANAGYVFAGWVGYSACGNVSTCTFNMPAAAVSLSATFTTATPSSSGLVAHYCFDDPANLGKDCGTNGNNGTTFGGVSAVTGKVGGAARFAGLSNPGYVRVPNSSTLQFGTTSSISFFVKIDDPSGMDGWGNKSANGQFAIIAKSADWAGAYWLLNVSANNELWSGFGAGSSMKTTVGTEVQGGWASGATGRWVHVVHVVDSIGFKTYLDGRLAWSMSGTVNFAQTNTQDMYIGQYSQFWYPLNGTLDELKIFNRAISVAEIQTLFSNGTPVTYSLTGSVAPVAAGTLSGTGTFEAGTPRVITATPNSGYAFAGWSGYAGCATANPCLFNMPAATVTLTANFTTVQPAKPLCSLTASPASVSQGGSSTLTAACTPAATSYVWTGGSCANSTASTCTVTPNTTTMYSVAGVNAGGVGIAANATVTVTNTKPACTLSASPTSIVEGGSSVLTVTCNPAANSYIWSGGTCTGNVASACRVTPTMTTTYSVSGSNSDGASGVVSVTVSVTPTSKPTCSLVASPIVVSAGGVATLTANCSPSATAYVWTNAGFSSSARSGSVAPTKPTLYSVVGINAVGSSNAATAAVYVCNTPPSQNYPGMSLTGTATAEQFASGIANDSIDGSAGVDTIVYACNKDSFTITKTASGWIVSSAAEGLDTLTNVERIKFGNGTLALDISGNAGQTYRLYQAAFNRVPDNGGLKYWISVMDGGSSLKDVALGFMGSPEFKSLYGSNPPNEDFVIKLYANILHRAPDPAGYAYWVDTLNAKLITQADALILLSESTENQAGVINAIINGIDLLN
jgi:hypothetical protein